MANVRIVGRLTLAIIISLLIANFALAAEKSYRIGVVLPDGNFVSSVEGLREGMKGLGYVAGRNAHYVVEDANGDKARIEAITKKFVAEKVDVIFTVTNTALKIVAQASQISKHPVVFGSASGPVESGIIPGYDSRTTHITGVTSTSIELVAKRLEITKEILPRVKKITLIGELGSDSSQAAVAIARRTAPKLGLSLVELMASNKNDAIEIVKKTSRKETEVLFVVPGLAIGLAFEEIAHHAKAARLPLGATLVEHVRDAGALYTYGSSFYLQGKQAALLVERILKGASPAELPIEKARLYQLVLNLDTAKVIGVRFSPAVLNRADELVGTGAR